MAHLRRRPVPSARSGSHSGIAEGSSGVTPANSSFISEISVFTEIKDRTNANVKAD
ncbi:hypothetical protein [Jeongeupia chitinilytica]|uniref:hypothetical protein n=1 Tax=Jeongeupia chitinilytica TaxID=1041641 RepID=UPI0016770FD9|nr:hypothetical protein [Jeongeupia chitinilytica]